MAADISFGNLKEILAAKTGGLEGAIAPSSQKQKKEEHKMFWLWMLILMVPMFSSSSTEAEELKINSKLFSSRGIVYAEKASEENFNIKISSLDESSKETFLDYSRFDYAPSVSRDGRFVLFISQQSLDFVGYPHFLVDVKEGSISGEIKKLTRRTLVPGTLSPDGKKIAFIGTGGEPGIYDIQTQTHWYFPVTDCQDIDWSPSGNFVVFSKTDLKKGSSIFIGIGNVFTKTFSPLTQKIVSGGFETQEKPAWSPDGTSVIFLSSIPPTGGGYHSLAFWVVNKDGSGQKKLFDWRHGGIGKIIWIEENLLLIENFPGSSKSEFLFVDLDGRVIRNFNSSNNLSSPSFFDGSLAELEPATPWDINGDGAVNIFDLVIIGSQFGQSGAGLAGDVNDDGAVNIFDLVIVGAHFGETTKPAAAPSALFSSEMTASDRAALAKLLDTIEQNEDAAGVITVKNLLRTLLEKAPILPKQTRLLPNFPNPFNPETWIPYQLAKDSSVTLTIYDMMGKLIRTIPVGHKPADMYESRDKAIYWDGRNDFGETVASGIYFYTLTAKDFTATRKMVILK